MYFIRFLSGKYHCIGCVDVIVCIQAIDTTQEHTTMISTIITQRVIVGPYRTETGYGVTTTRRVVKMETVKHVEYDMPGRKGTTIHYSYNTLDTVCWYQDKGYAGDVKGSIQFGASSQGIGDTIPEWAQ
jgi:hypothetical protein